MWAKLDMRILQRLALNNPRKRMSTELSKHVLNLKDNNTNFQITLWFWSHLSHTNPLPNGVIYVWGRSILLSPSRICQNLTSATNLYLRVDTCSISVTNFKSPFVTQQNLWKWPFIYSNGILRAHDCKYRGSLARLKKSKILIICQKNPFGELSSKKIFSTFKNECR